MHDHAGRPRARLTANGRTWHASDLPTLPGDGGSYLKDVAVHGHRWVAVGEDVVYDGPQPGRYPGVWVSDDATTWRRVPMRDLAGPALQRLTDARAVVVRDGRWLVYGTTTPEVDSRTGVERVLWRGR